MRFDIKETILFMTLGIVILQGLIYYDLNEKIQIITQELEQPKTTFAKMAEPRYDPSQHFWNHSFSTYASGYYVPGCGFWVDTRGRFIDDINGTIDHESLHALIEQDAESYKHFCQED